ncbi:MAG: transposase-like protein [Pseudoalteromonas tetraodonis]|jgi:transposase-like protein
MSKRKIYSSDFKNEALAMVDSSPHSASAVVRDLGIRPALLYRWRTEQKAPGLQAFKGRGIPRDEELLLLKRENARRKTERDFLRDAAGIVLDV